jgi:hypothetical protein
LAAHPSDSDRMGRMSQEDMGRMMDRMEREMMDRDQRTVVAVGDCDPMMTARSEIAAAKVIRTRIDLGIE